MNVEPVRVLIADDHPHFRDGLRALLLSASDLEVVGEAEDGEGAIGLAAKLQPDVILMDLNMPRVGGIEATRRILRTSFHIAILVISMFEDDDSIFATLQGSARGFLLKVRSRPRYCARSGPSQAARRSSAPPSLSA